MNVIAKDERITNERALNACIIERITGESATATLGHTAIAGSMRAISVERRLQELSDSITQCVEAKRRKNNRFWNYLMHLEDHLHQFAVYMKNKNKVFPDTLL